MLTFVGVQLWGSLGSMDILTSPGCKRQSIETTRTVHARLNPWRVLRKAENPGVGEPKYIFDPHADGGAEDLIPKARSRRRGSFD